MNADVWQQDTITYYYETNPTIRKLGSRLNYERDTIDYAFIYNEYNYDTTLAEEEYLTHHVKAEFQGRQTQNSDWVEDTLFRYKHFMVYVAKRVTPTDGSLLFPGSSNRSLDAYALLNEDYFVTIRLEWNDELANDEIVVADALQLTDGIVMLSVDQWDKLKGFPLDADSTFPSEDIITNWLRSSRFSYQEFCQTRDRLRANAIHYSSFLDYFYVAGTSNELSRYDSLSVTSFFSEIERHTEEGSEDSNYATMTLMTYFYREFKQSLQKYLYNDTLNLCSAIPLTVNTSENKTTLKFEFGFCATRIKDPNERYNWDEPSLKRIVSFIRRDGVWEVVHH
ncbi:MAG: hypothetical protein ACKVOR_03115 [Flavobacteriales bacterium]